MFNEWLINQRKQSGMSVKTLSEKSGVSISYIKKLECGSVDNPTKDVMVKLLNVYGYNLNIDLGDGLYVKL